MSRTENDHDDDSPGGAGGGGTLPRTWQQSPESRTTSARSSEPLGGGGLTSLAVAEPTLVVYPVEEAASFVAAPVHAPVQVGDLYAADEPVVEPLSGFGETGPLHLTDQGRTFLVDYEEDGPRTRPAWMWVGLFAATGILAIVGTVWWFTLRDSGTALATSVSERKRAGASGRRDPNRQSHDRGAGGGCSRTLRPWYRSAADGVDSHGRRWQGRQPRVSGRRDPADRRRADGFDSGG